MYIPDLIEDKFKFTDLIYLNLLLNILFPTDQPI